MKEWSALIDEFDFWVMMFRPSEKAGLASFSVRYMSGSELEKTVILSFDEVSDYIHLKIITTEDAGAKEYSAWLRVNNMEELRMQFFDLLRRSATENNSQ